MIEDSQPIKHREQTFTHYSDAQVCNNALEKHDMKIYTKYGSADTSAA